jgi:hypothetical protein
VAREEGEAPVRLATAIYVEITDCIQALGKDGRGEGEQRVIIVDLEVSG